MVEAAGIEPASEDNQQRVSTRLSSSVISLRGAGWGRAPRNQLCGNFTPELQSETRSLSCWSTLPGSRRS